MEDRLILQDILLKVCPKSDIDRILYLCDENRKNKDSENVM